MKKITVTPIMLTPDKSDASLNYGHLVIDGFRFGYDEAYRAYLVSVIVDNEQRDFFTSDFSSLCSDLIPRASARGYDILILSCRVKYIVSAPSVYFHDGDFFSFLLV